MSTSVALRVAVLAYLGVILLAPLAMVFQRTFEHGPAPVWAAVVRPDTLHALWMTVLMTVIAVPLNTVFGVLFGLAVVRGRLPAGRLLHAMVDLPQALSPVVVGLSLYLLYGRGGWFGAWLAAHGVRVLFAWPGMALATVFVSLPFVVHEVVPVLRALGTDQEQAAATLGATPLQTFRRITLPAVRFAVAYGVVLTAARSLGEYGAVSVVSGQIAGLTETLTIHVQQAYESFDTGGAYASAVLLALMAVAVLLVMNILRRKGAPVGD